jgi:hypothetical protein
VFLLPRKSNVSGTPNRLFRLFGHLIRAALALEKVFIILAKAFWKAFIDGLALHATSEAGWSHHVLLDHRKEFEASPDAEPTQANCDKSGYFSASAGLSLGEPPAHEKLPPPHRIPPSWIEFDDDDR